MAEIKIFHVRSWVVIYPFVKKIQIKAFIIKGSKTALAVLMAAKDPNFRTGNASVLSFEGCD